MTLHLYFARKFLTTFLALIGGFTVFMWLVELLEHIRRFDSGSVGFGYLAYMALLHLPEVLYQILALVVLLAAIAMFIGLARTSELVVTRATGRSALRSLAAPVLAALLLGTGFVAIGNPLVAALSKEYRAEENRLRGSERIVSVSREGLWLRQGSAERQTAIHAESANLDGTQLFGVTFFGFDRSDVPLYRLDADEAVLSDGAWIVRNAKRWDFTTGLNPEATATAEATSFVATDLTRDQIRDSFGTPSAIPIWDLPDFIAKLENAGFSARSHRVWFQAELAKPLTFVAMVLMGAVFTLRHTRLGRTGLMVLFAVLSGFGVYFTANLAQVMGDSGQIPVGLAIWAPPSAAILIALGLLLHFEDG
ncbi:LPS export ABC transporter permease LptG [Meridianimarinicoccus roseus]|jgi:lipopolysaccharide export system permease protein|uniref:LPS export ABC transporter permease LptG n=1 Tax=Meridianimarinicoccus roseus TaxID=2072018 RepID=A0A2V2LGY4_9RHOB|nr:LPS export ABC transporter permease LptG [Meridianimarinicoccus roseus]PWR03231.1 LPS export ABC transporter permease LptG [Meridianimarinicoccus roseus]